MGARLDAIPSGAWLQSIDATYRLFEAQECRDEYGQLADKVREAVKLCEEVVQEFGINQCPLSFNGGKDCTVLIHILAAVLRRLHESPSPPTSSSSHPSSSSYKLDDLLPPIPSLYITCTSPFEQVEDFVADSIQRYNMKIVKLSGGMKEGLERYLDGEGQVMVTGKIDGGVEVGEKDGKKREVKAMFIGTRRTDPHGAKLKPRNHTDEGWPDVERVQPILDWTYQDVWSFLRCPLFAISEQHIGQSNEGLRWGEPYGIPYCVLYDEGYTSLGSTFNTFPNPVLETCKDEPGSSGGKSEGKWKPAYMLQDESLERAGRMPSVSN